MKKDANEINFTFSLLDTQINHMDANQLSHGVSLATEPGGGHGLVIFYPSSRVISVIPIEICRTLPSHSFSWHLF